MSAYIVDRSHIDAIVRLAISGPRDPRPVNPGTVWHGTTWYAADARATVAPAVDHNDYFRLLETIHRSADHETADRTARMLISENVASVQYRYPDDPADLPGPRPMYWDAADLETYHVRTVGPMPTAVEGLKLIDCYEYQSCEHPGWLTSEAWRFCDALRSRLISALPGYDEAAWEWSNDATAAVGW